MKVETGFVTVIDFQGTPEKLWIAENSETRARILAEYYAIILDGKVKAFRVGEKDGIIVKTTEIEL